MRLDEPLNGQFGERPVRILELSLTGFLIAHEGRLSTEHEGLLRFEPGWGFSADKSDALTMRCVIARSTLWRLAKGLGEKSVYHSGLRITDTSPETFDRLRELIAVRVIRALEEMKANARGLPPLEAYLYQPFKGDLFRRCEFVDGAWRKSETVRSVQPKNGFTISAEVEPVHVDMLCRTWEETSEEGRRLTQILAELSVSRAEGGPTRKYVP